MSEAQAVPSRCCMDERIECIGNECELSPLPGIESKVSFTKVGDLLGFMWKYFLQYQFFYRCCVVNWHLPEHLL